jgi:hypothetical protein
VGSSLSVDVGFSDDDDDGNNNKNNNNYYFSCDMQRYFRSHAYGKPSGSED